MLQLSASQLIGLAAVCLARSNKLSKGEYGWLLARSNILVCSQVPVKASTAYKLKFCISAFNQHGGANDQGISDVFTNKRGRLTTRFSRCLR